MRRISAAFACLMLVCLSLGVGAYLGGLYGAHRGFEAQSSHAPRQSENAYPSQIDRNRAGLPDPVERIASNPDPKDGTEREKRDLAAQEAMVVWSFWALTISAFGLVVTSVGTGLLLWQIKLTREAVADTGKATRAMERQNEIAERTARAWLTVQDIPYAIFNGELDGKKVESGLRIWFVWSNTGPMPALNVRFSNRYVIFDAHLPPLTLGDNFTNAGCGVTMGVNSPHSAGAFFLTDDQANGLRDQSLRMIIYSKVLYYASHTDKALGIERYSEAAFEVVHEGRARSGSGEPYESIQFRSFGDQHGSS